MKGQAGIQMNVHPKFLDLMHNIQDERIRMKLDSKSGENSLSHKRLTLTIYKVFKNRPDLYNLVLNAQIDKNEN